MEIRTELKVVAYIEEMTCDVCGIGKMEAKTGTMLMSNPPKYPHECSNCGRRSHYTKSYPCKSFDAVPFNTGMVYD